MQVLKNQLVSLKTNFRSLFPIGDLIDKPKKDEIYLELFKSSVKEMNSYASGYVNGYIMKWIDSLALQLSVSIKKNSPNWVHGYVIYKLLNQYSQKSHKKVISYFETGTAKGFSAIIAAKAIQDAGKIPNIFTVDILNDEKKRFWNSIGDYQGRRNQRELLKEYEEFLRFIRFFKKRTSRLDKSSIPLQRIDFAFLDGSHTYSSVRNEFRLIRQMLEHTGIIMFDDYDQKNYPGVCKAVNEIDINNLFFIDNGFSSRKYAIYSNNSSDTAL